MLGKVERDERGRVRELVKRSCEMNFGEEVWLYSVRC